MLFYMQLRNWFLIFIMAVMMMVIHQKSQHQKLNPVRSLTNLALATASR